MMNEFLQTVHVLTTAAAGITALVMLVLVIKVSIKDHREHVRRGGHKW